MSQARPRIGGYALAFAGGVVATLLVGAADPFGGLDLFARVLTDIDTQYERPLALDTLVHAALGGIGTVLDEHSAYYSPEAWGILRGAESGVALGIGATLAKEPCGLRLAALEPWGAAENAGLKVGDCVVAANGAALIQPADPTQLLGPEHTAVRLTVRRGEVEWEVALLRARAREPAVRVQQLPGGVVYARVGHFGDPVAAPLARAVAERSGMRAMILDLRSNPGGRVEEAGALVDRFVGTGTIVTTRTRSGGDTRIVATKSSADWTLPLVVMVDGETASAAEIVAGALHDLKRATLVGTRTYGKGSVQRVFQYEDGSALKLTVGRYYLPGGEPIPDHQGLTPDIEVAFPAAADGTPGAPGFRGLADPAADPPLAAALSALAPTKR
ncbi:peptidase S41 [Deltaproteobacteria bacterium]|nr:peptidase S41 [Deltaproteobacteria bacterium]